jgi:DNA-binding TFAR19-related protein (PDSD5 family)
VEQKYPFVTIQFVAAVDRYGSAEEQLEEARQMARQLHNVLYESSWKRGTTVRMVELLTADQIENETLGEIRLEAGEYDDEED